MHPPLYGHPTCREVIENLHRCHKERYIAKFFGACNNERAAVDRCLQAEFDDMMRRRKEERYEKRIRRKQQDQ
jgi:COX assembly protein 2